MSRRSNNVDGYIEEYKPCPKCGEPVWITISRKKHGKYACSKCIYKQWKDWVDNHKEQYSEGATKRTIKYQRAHPERLPTKEQISAYGRKHHLEKKYGITEKQYDEMLDRQNGKCAICGTDKPDGRFNRFHVDHNHITGKIRGLLCAKCNLGLGKFSDSQEMLDALIGYLEKYERNNHGK